MGNSSFQSLIKEHGALVKKELRSRLQKVSDWKFGWVLPKSDATTWFEQSRIKNFSDFMVLLASVEGTFSASDISNYKVQIVGQENESGDLLFGGNLEFPGTDLGLTIHAEQFLMTRAFHRGTSIKSFALAEATPCGHCRQFILEFAEGKNIRVYNSFGFDLRIADLIPFDFGPEQLKAQGIGASRKPKQLKMTSTVKVPSKLFDAVDGAIAAAANSYAPYSQTVSGVAIVADIFVPGSYIESAAFNPSLSPFQTALINFIASGRTYKEIESVILIQTVGKVDHSARTKALLKTLAPKARLIVLEAT